MNLKELVEELKEEWAFQKRHPELLLAAILCNAVIIYSILI